jgi:hypothetical protein
MTMTGSTQEEHYDLANERLDERATEAPLQVPSRAAIVERLEAYRILPPSHTLLGEHTLEQIEQLFVTWFELQDDASRRSAISYLFAGESEVRTALLAIVPLYYDSMFFDERTPTRDLVEIALVAHAKWRRWLAPAS